MRTIVLGDIIREIVEKTTINNQYPVLTSSQSGLVSQGEYFNKQIASQDNTGYKIIRKGQFAYSSMQTGRDECIRIALYDKEDPCLISPAYSVLQLKDTSVMTEYRGHLEPAFAEMVA